jgi:hypothetical protein
MVNWKKGFRWGMAVLGIGLILLAVLAFHGPHWFNLPVWKWAWLVQWQPDWLWMQRFPIVPPYFWIALTFLLVGLVLAGTSGLFAGPSDPVLGKWVRWRSPGWVKSGLSLVALLGGLIFLWIESLQTNPELNAFPWLLSLSGLLAFAWLLDPSRPSWRGGVKVGGMLLLILLMAWLFREASLPPLAFVLLVGAAWAWLAAKRGREEIGLGLLLLFSFGYHVHDIHSWRYACIGDEYAFYDTLLNLQKPGAVWHYLDGRGVYGDHSIASSLHQAWISQWLGNGVYGWRISEVMSVHAAAVFLYYFLRRFLSVSGAVVGISIFLASQHVATMAKIGYVMCQGLVPLTACWLALAIAVQKRSLTAAVLAGMFAAGGFYTFSLAVPLVVVAALFFGLYLIKEWISSGRRMEGGRWFCLAIAGASGFMVTACPRGLVLDWYQNLALRTGLTHHESDPSGLVWHVMSNSLYTVASPLFFQNPTHYTSGPLVDPLSLLLLLVGVVGWIGGGWRTALGWWAVLGVLLSDVLVGGLNIYDYPPNTRVFLLLPFLSVLGALGWESLRLRMVSMKRFSIFNGGLTVVVITGLFGLNYLQMYPLLDRTFQRIQYHFLVRRFEESSQERRFVMVAREAYVYDQNFETVLRAHGYDPTRLTYLPNHDPEQSLQHLKKNVPAPFELWIPWDAPERDHWLEAARQIFPGVDIIVEQDGVDVKHLAHLLVLP